MLCIKNSIITVLDYVDYVDVETNIHSINKFIW